MTEPWNFTEAQRRQFREAHAEAKRTPAAGFSMCTECGGIAELPATVCPACRDTGFSGWDLNRLTAQRDHLQSILLVSAGQADRTQICEEYDAVCAEIAKRSSEEG